MVRVGTKGARVVILEFGKPSQPGWRFLFLSYLKWVVPIFGKIFAGDFRAYAYILESLNVYPNHTEVSQYLKEAGCRNIECQLFFGGAMTLHVAEVAH